MASHVVLYFGLIISDYVENWVFNQKEIHFIANLMIEKLRSLPDNSELSVMNLFKQVLSAEYLRVKDDDAFYFQGYKITDIALPDGKYLHDFIRWDFGNGLWQPHIEQGFALEDAFYVKAKRMGYVIDGSRHAGGKVGVPYDIPRVFRMKKNLISSFMNPDNSVTIQNRESSYRLLTKYESKQYQYTDNPSGKLKIIVEKKALQLLVLPVGCSTGKVFHKEGNICFYVLKGKCHYSDLYWDYCAFYPKRKEKWDEMKSQYELRFNKSAFSRKNRHTRDIEAPSDAWYQITNTGKSDLLVFVADQSLTEQKHIEMLESEKYIVTFVPYNR